MEIRIYFPPSRYWLRNVVFSMHLGFKAGNDTGDPVAEEDGGTVL